LDKKGASFGHSQRWNFKKNANMISVGPGDINLKSSFSHKGGVMLRNVQSNNNKGNMPGPG
jgi:hypothetical protein